MIAGMGVDIIEIERIENEIQQHGESFTTRVFTPEEIKYCETKMHRAQHYAARFAVKEAVFKALGTGWQKGVSWKDAVITNDDLGKPEVQLYGRAKELADKMGMNELLVSISHSLHYAVAVVIIQ